MSVRIPVRAERSYDVVVGENLLDELPGMLGPDARRVAVLHAAPLDRLAVAVEASLRSAGYRPVAVEVPDAESGKTAEVAASCWALLGREGFTRTDAVVGVGGGAVTDLAGFVAATWLRGVRVVQVPTSLLAMVDAAVGGKTGINTAEGKNLVGSFHSPTGVLADLATLRALPRAEYVAGLAEVVKCGFIADPVILERIEADPVAAVDPTAEVAAELVERAIRIKARVVSADFTETGADTEGGIGREILNYGHTFGHAVENLEHYRWRHGSAVAVGMVFVAELATVTGHLDRATAARHAEILTAVGLPTTYRGGVWPQLLEVLRRDKKTRGDRLRFVVLDGLARAAILESPDPEALLAAYAKVSAA